jgi:uncharacterized protein YfaS (alpha-2-macroglobulin family)
MKKLLVFTLVLFIAGLSACKQKKKEEKVVYTEEQAKVVSMVTNGEIRNTDAIAIQFVNEVVSNDEINKELDVDYFKFAPSIKGKIIWRSTNRLVFEPDEPLPFRKTYEGEINLAAISNDFEEKNLPNIKFNFSVAGKEITQFDGELILKNRNNPKVLRYRGKMKFSQAVDPELLEKAFQVKPAGKTMQIELTPESGNATYNYTIGDLERTGSTKTYTIIIDKDKLGLPDDFEKTFDVTPLEQMKVVSVDKDEKDKSPRIRVNFSDEFDPEQSLNGLFITEPASDLKLTRIGNTVVLAGNFKFGTTYTIKVAKGIKSRWGTETDKEFSKSITFADIQPQIEFASDGVFLPSGNQYKVQFYTSNLKRVHIEVKKVYEKSLAEFLRTEQLTSVADRKAAFNEQYINRVGVIVHNETFEIGDEKNNWLLSEIDLSHLVNKNDKGLYLIRLNFNPRDMLVDANSTDYKYIEENGQIYKPVFFSNIGLTCKRDDDTYHVFATDINTAKPMSGVKIKLMSSSNEVEATATTDGKGFATLSGRNYWYYYIVAEKNNDRSVITLSDMEWNISGFDIGGSDEYQPNTKAYIYTERGVYRPGDEVNISVIARFVGRQFPENHPITMELYNPQGKKVYELTNRNNTDGFYNFKFETKESDATGTWRAQFNIGNKTFSHAVKVETVVPYRLKIRIEPEQPKILWNHTAFKLNLSSTYLFGNPAGGLKAEVDAEVYSVNKRFSAYENFTFANPCIDFQAINQKLFDGVLDTEGTHEILWNLPDVSNTPSALRVRLTSKVLEKGGRPNENVAFVDYEPYAQYVGLQAPKYHYVAAGSDVQIPVMLVSSDGKPVPGKSLKYRIYRNSENWWWQYDGNNQLRFKSDKNTTLIKEGKINSGSTHAILKFVPIEHGDYLIEVSDDEGTGHSSGVFISAYRYGSSGGEDKNAGTLPLSSNKNKYFTGEEAIIQFPSPEEGIALVTVEKEDQILYQEWHYPTGGDQMEVKIPITNQMVPNAYVSVSLLQPHAQTVNDRPIRMFGIVPIMVEREDSRHEIEIKTARQFRPKEPFEVVLQTTDFKPTQFTIAVVDEGLLDITNHKTPNPWVYFFAKVRLKIRTYDLFSHIISANKGDVFKTFAIGGDMDYRESQLNPGKQKKRFKPVSLFQGPVETDANGKAVVKFDMPNYVGSVRIMVIGARKNSYARAEKTVPVKSELMVLPTLPRVIGPGEKFTIPVSVFAMENGIGNVNVTVNTEGPFEIEGNASQALQFAKATDKDCYFNIKAKEEVGQGKITIKAGSAKYTSDYVVDLFVRPSAPRSYKSTEGSVEPGKAATINVPGNGIQGTNRVTITISRYPGIDFSHRLKYLIHYPYGCIEQTTSAVFPQLFIKQIMDYPDAFAKEVDDNISSGLERLRRFQIYSGAFSYWPYGESASEWGTLYGGHFMVEAKKLGYHVTDDLYENWVKYTERMARQGDGGLATRVYRVYILALNGSPVNSEMNLLKENKLRDMDNTQKWMLAAAYHLAGMPDKVGEIVAGADFSTKDYQEFSGTYGSGLRDKGMILDALVAMGRMDEAESLVREISKYISTSQWYSTQTIGYSLLGIGKYVSTLQKNGTRTNLKGSVMLANGNKVPFNTDKTFTYRIEDGFGMPIRVTLDDASGVSKAFTTLAWDGVPFESETKDEQNNLALNVTWYNEEGEKIDVHSLKQGSTFWGYFQVENISDLDRVDEIALVQILPSGWEIENTRLSGESMPTWSEGMMLNYEDYVDVRDDRIMWFFDLYRERYNHSSKHNKLEFLVKLNAVTLGEYDLAPTLVEAMYNGSFKATKAGYNVNVIR